MKRALAIILVLLMVTLAPAAALVRELDPETETRLTQAVLDQYPDGQVTASRIWDFWNIGRSVFCLTLDLGEETVEVYIDIDSEALLTQADLDQLQSQEDAAQEDDPVPYPDTALDPAPNQPGDELPATGTTMFYWLGGLVILAGVFLLGRQLLIKKA